MKTPQTILLLIFLFSAIRPLAAQVKFHREDYSPRIKTYENGEQEVEVKQVIPAPTNGVFWPLSGDFPPTPFGPNPKLKLPVYFWSDGTFLFDDENLDYHALKESGIPLFNTGNFSLKSGAMQTAAEGPPVPGEGGTDTNADWPTNSFPAAFTYTNGELYLDIYSCDSNWMTLKVVNTLENNFYEIFTKTNLSETNWTLDHGLIGAAGMTIANPISVIGKANLFFRARNSGLDEDGDGLPDWWEMENGLDPSLADTGNTGTSDGYKDGDGDGWSNLEEFQNGNSPSGFNTPPAPRGLTVALNGSGTIADLNWNQSGGSVTGYEIEREDYFNPGNFSVVASVQSFTDNSVVAPSDPFWGTPSYRIRATYSTGNSAWSSLVPIYSEQDTSDFWLIRGPSGDPYLISSALPQDAVGIKIKTVAYYNYSDVPVITESVLSTTNFINGIAHLSDGQIHSGSGFYDGNSFTHWAQAVLSDGKLGKLEVIFDGKFGNVSYFDGREQLKQNLSFLLRAADMQNPFDLYLDSPFYDGLRSVTGDYAYASYYNRFSVGLHFTDMMEFRPFEDNYIYRNFAFEMSHLDSLGRLTNGIDFISGYDVPYIDLSVAPYRFEPPTNTVFISTVLSSDQSEWIYHWEHDERIGIGFDPQNYTDTLTNGSKNLFGLDYLSVRTMVSTSNGRAVVDIDPGQTVQAGDYFYPKVAQPILRTVDHYFGKVDTDPLPGDGVFSPTNLTPLFLMSGNYPPESNGDAQGLQFAGYAKKTIDNGDPNKFGYLGLYFDKACKVNFDGTISTNETGILSEYGEFFPTEPGRVALITKPESDGETNVGICVVNVMKLELDVNHDGTIDRSITGPDNTSYERPFVFWINNDFDRGHNVDCTLSTCDFEEDDLKVGGTPGAPSLPTPDYAYASYAPFQPAAPAIPSMRDLEDYTRLWISGVSNVMAVMPSNYTVKLTLNGDAAIRLFRTVQADGGTNYLFDEITASSQVAQSASLYVGLLTSSSPIILTNLAEHYIWCGVARGSADIHLQILDGEQNLVADTATYIQLKGIKEMYERWTVGDVASIAPVNLAYTAVEDLLPGASSLRYDPPETSGMPYILMVHGWNMETWEKDRFAETAFKRLYWQGYRGRFGLFRWPTDNRFDGLWDAATDRRNYDRSEFNAWRSAIGLRNLLTRLKLTDHSVYLLAHSMGNVVAGEALRLATNQLVNVYIASQAAVPAHMYDNSISSYSFSYLSQNFGPITPNIYSNWFTGSIGAGQRINFYNTNDYALLRPRWELNQLLKPDQATSLGWSYVFSGYPNDGLQHYTPGVPDDMPPWNHFLKDSFSSAVTFDIVNSLENRYEVMAFADQSRSAALGRTANIGNFSGDVDLARSSNPIWPTDTSGHAYSDHKWHSAQFRSTNMRQKGYWRTLLGNEGFNLSNP